MNVAKNGDTVTVHFTGRLEDGKIFDTSKGGKPLKFTIGTDTMMPGLEKGVLGMRVGETKTVIVVPEDAYGPRSDALLLSVRKDALQQDMNPTIGQPVRLRKPGDGSFLTAYVAAVNEETITLDANHPLAGKILTLEIELVAVA